MSPQQPKLAPSELHAAMQRAVHLAQRGPDNTPNPQVGCVILDEIGRIVAEGWHQGAGTPHAETAALSALPIELQFPQEIKKLTAVVTLEPCNHTGRTGPCAAALIAAGIGKVVYGAADPTVLAAGGAAKLQAAGVTTELLPDAGAAQLRAAWQSRVGAQQEPAVLRNADKQQVSQQEPTDSAAASVAASTAARPYTILKWAQTIDGRAAANDGSSWWITGAAARADVHQRRASCDLIGVGSGTLYADNPSLTARDKTGKLLVPAALQPLPVVFGNREIPATAAIRQHPALAAHGLSEPLRQPRGDLAAALENLAAAGYRSLFIEGGPQLISEFLRAGLYDELLIYVAPALAGGAKLALGDIGVESITDLKRFTTVQRVQLEQDTLLRITRATDSNPANDGSNQER